MFSDYLPAKMKALRSFETSGTTRDTKQRRVADDQSPQQHRPETLATCLQLCQYKSSRSPVMSAVRTGAVFAQWTQ